MKQRSNKSTLMLLEIMINICFFSALIAVCLVLLFRAFHISNRAVSVNHGVSILNSIAAVYESSSGDYDVILSRFPEAVSVQGSSSFQEDASLQDTASLQETENGGRTLLFYYDKAFRASAEADAVYRAVLTSGTGSSAGNILTAHLAFEQIETQELLYEEELTVHVPFSIESLQ